jgi:four helix bundle protein
MGVYRFEDLEVWKMARTFCKEVGDAIQSPEFQGEPTLRERLNKTSFSILENIAEGFERESRKEFAQFTRVARASNGEARALLYAAADRGCLQAARFATLMEHNIALSKMLRSLHKALCQPRCEPHGAIASSKASR